MIIPKNLYYTKNHLWLRKIGLCDFCIGITDFAQKETGKIDLIELNVEKNRLAKSALWGVIYGTNATFSLIAPCECEITTMNTVLNTHPSQINLDPYDSWVLSISANISTQEFLTQEEYLKLIR
ncbi:glycine cleavage system protein H [Chryseobacterium aahli]|uniref:glycine cleavage system protein H n=1 Tax=Chryseobacterium aahli TaxID=1278643 RepID=UPI001F6214DE|nr:glycine cleavage system protein H [Chryseobacterium aahli]MCI3936318.1 glycine cleavage system protein H [Chryseobacterium aahli]